MLCSFNYFYVNLVYYKKTVSYFISSEVREMRSFILIFVFVLVLT